MEERTFDELIDLVRNDENWHLPIGLEGLKETFLSDIAWSILGF